MNMVLAAFGGFFAAIITFVAIVFLVAIGSFAKIVIQEHGTNSDEG